MVETAKCHSAIWWPYANVLLVEKGFSSEYRYLSFMFTIMLLGSLTLSCHAHIQHCYVVNGVGTRLNKISKLSWKLTLLTPSCEPTLNISAQTHVTLWKEFHLLCSIFISFLCIISLSTCIFEKLVPWDVSMDLDNGAIMSPYSLQLSWLLHLKIQPFDFLNCSVYRQSYNFLVWDC
jgi:hypothetical protein